jgi:hypothetical protein
MLFIVEIDHKNLLYVAKSETPKVVRWRTFLGEFDCDIRHIVYPRRDPISFRTCYSGSGLTKVADTANLEER